MFSLSTKDFEQNHCFINWPSDEPVQDQKDMTIGMTWFLVRYWLMVLDLQEVLLGELLRGKILLPKYLKVISFTAKFLLLKNIIAGNHRQKMILWTCNKEMLVKFKIWATGFALYFLQKSMPEKSGKSRRTWNS